MGGEESSSSLHKPLKMGILVLTAKYITSDAFSTFFKVGNRFGSHKFFFSKTLEFMRHFLTECTQIMRNHVHYLQILLFVKQIVIAGNAHALKLAYVMDM